MFFEGLDAFKSGPNDVFPSAEPPNPPKEDAPVPGCDPNPPKVDVELDPNPPNPAVEELARSRAATELLVPALGVEPNPANIPPLDGAANPDCAGVELDAAPNPNPVVLGAVVVDGGNIYINNYNSKMLGKCAFNRRAMSSWIKDRVAKI